MPSVNLRTAAFLSMALIILAAACGGGGPNYSAKDVSIDLWHESDYCNQRYCPEPLENLSLLGNWTISYYFEYGGEEQRVQSGYYVEMQPAEPLNFTSVEEPCCMQNSDHYNDYYYGFLDRYAVDAFDKIINRVTIFEDETAAKDAMESVHSRGGQAVTSDGPGPGIELSAKDSQPLEIVGYDDALINTEPAKYLNMHTVWIRRAETIIEVRGQFDNVVDDGTAKRGVILAAAMLLARADAPAPPMTLSGNLYLDGHLLPAIGEDDVDRFEFIDFLEAQLDPYSLALTEFVSSPDYTIELRGTRSMRGQEVTFELSHGPGCHHCSSLERISFEPGHTKQIDLHFESSR